MTEDRKTLTTESGVAMPDNQNSLTAGPRGPVLMTDWQLNEKMAHFNRERVPERVVHAKGYGAYGTFSVTGDITKYTRAKVFTPGSETPVFARFSTVGGESGSADTERDPRGFALKFYTTEGNWDLVGNNTPIFFVRDALKFSDFIRTQKREPRSHLKPHWRRWDFWSLVPESLHQVMILYSDRGTPVSARFMNGYGSHTYSFWNEAGERYWVKFHVKTQQGIKNFGAKEAKQVGGEQPDFSTNDLYTAIESGDFPKWTVFVQIMPEAEAASYPWHPFDLTKVWLQSDFPLIEVGRMELNRNPDNYFQDVEQAAFDVSNVVPGISFSPDKMLQNRVLSYADAHRYRIGINYNQIPVNQAKHAKVANYNRDGNMRVDGNSGGAVDYEPNSFGGPVQDLSVKGPPERIVGDVDRYNSYDCDDTDYYGQPRLFWERALDEGGRNRLVESIVESMGDSPERIQRKMIGHFYKIHHDFGRGVAQGLEFTDNQKTAAE